MGTAYVPTIHLVSEEEASDEVRQIFNEIKEFFNLDFVPQIFRSVAHDPRRLHEVWNLHKDLYTGKLGIDPKVWESIGLTVASTRSCPYCINWHITMLKAMGMSDAEIESLVNVIGISNMFITYTVGIQHTPDVTPDLVDRLSKSEALKGRKEAEVKASM